MVKYNEGYDDLSTYAALPTYSILPYARFDNVTKSVTNSGNNIQAAQGHFMHGFHANSFAVDRHFMRDRVNMHGRHGVVEAHVLLADCACLTHGLQLPPALEAFAQSGVQRGLRDEGDDARASSITSSLMSATASG
jgi:hypothetical protein